jgi:putative addiction module component (TIGR02574 family)
MTRDTSNLLKKALTLSAPERAELVDSLIESLDGAKDKSVPAAWDFEVARRMAEMDSGTVKPVGLAVARRRLAAATE